MFYNIGRCMAEEELMMVNYREKLYELLERLNDDTIKKIYNIVLGYLEIFLE